MRIDTYSCIICRVQFNLNVDGNAERMAKLVSRGSAGCIAAMDKMNHRTYIVGAEPWLGVQLNVNWTRLKCK